MSRPEFITDENGKITGYKTLGGADTVFPFSSFYLIANGTTTASPNGNIVNLTCNKKPRVIITQSHDAGHQHAVYWEPGAYGVDQIPKGNTHLLAYDVTDKYFKISSNNTLTYYDVRYWCFA